MTMLTDEHVVLDAYVNSDRNQIVLRADSWESVRKYNAILFRELENGAKQISCGDFLDTRGTIEEIKRYVRTKLLKWICECSENEFDFYENIMSADICLESDYQKEVQG